MYVVFGWIKCNEMKWLKMLETNNDREKILKIFFERVQNYYDEIEEEIGDRSNHPSPEEVY